MRMWLALGLALLAAWPARARDVWFAASDGARLHYTEVGPAGAPVVVFVPGWAMPGWIFTPQIRVFSKRYRVVAFDPRGQGSSEVALSGYDAARRGEDLADLLRRLPGRVVVVGWSLGVLDTLAYVHAHGQVRLAGLVLVDNSVGENPPPVVHHFGPGPEMTHAVYMRRFVAGMFRTPQSPAYLDRLTAATLRLPPADAAALLSYREPRSYWKAALLLTDVPVLYAVRPALQAQADNLLIDRPNTEIAVFPAAGHALFVDDAARFDALLAAFLARAWH